MSGIDNYQDLIDVRDIIEQVEGLQDTLDPETGVHNDNEDREEYERLLRLLDKLRGNGRGEQWRGDWYPLTLIRDSYFETYAQDLAEDIGAINTAASWLATCIDWEQAASELQMDYTSAEYDGVTYWYR